ncbi:unnamed protein product [Phytophthora fragariaefolia]|uniref:Unnamed protein product n=1 Tax=Phytophthora fragariaefolia TaxID=1490495 RepID=A0A9W6XA07_9STRA|nr:unnamed protein product [Phytophthora fragariaefolia]
MTPSNMSTEASHFEAAINLQLLSKASGLESAAELDDEDEEEKEKATPVRRLRPRTVVKYDVNFVPEDEDGEDYESFGSSESDEGFGDEEDEPERGEGDDDEGVLTEGDAEQMDEAFIALLKIGNTRLTKAELKERQAALRATAWTTTSSQFDVGGSAYTGMDDEMAQPVPELRALADSPLQTLLYFMPKSLWVLINDQSNLYAGQQVGRRAQVLHERQRGRRVETVTQIQRRLKLKNPYETHEILHVIGLLRNTRDNDEAAFDHKTGAAAVVRNLKIVLQSNERHPWHAVVVDRFYSSVLLAIELLGMGIYVIGTIMTNRLGYDANVKEDRASRPASIPRGTFKFSRSVAVPSMVAFQWWDRKPVHYLCTGPMMTESSIGRKVKQVGAITVPCPNAVTDYQRWMGGVDVHDQLRLQRYSLQTSTKFKYYKSLFLGLVDMALVNAYLSHKEAAKMAETQPMKRGEWFTLLQNQLLQLKPQDFAGVVATPTIGSQKRTRAPARHTHAPEQSEDWVVVSGVQKRRQRSCKVCALLRTSKAKSFATTYYCERCSVDDAKCWLCNKIRREYKGAAKTCFEIWHDDFDAGESIPPSLGKRVVLRRPGKKAGVRKKTRRELQLRAEDADDESESDSEGGIDE